MNIEHNMGFSDGSGGQEVGVCYFGYFPNFCAKEVIDEGVIKVF